MTTVSLQSLNAADKAGFITPLGDIYEHAPWVAEAVLAQRPFASLAALHEAMMAAVRSAPAEQRTALLKGHPDLAGKAARAGTMTADSKAEQASAGLDRLSEAEYAAFHRHNDAYRSKFGIPFIVCARRHSKDSILRQFEHRLRNSVAAETKTALGNFEGKIIRADFFKSDFGTRFDLVYERTFLCAMHPRRWPQYAKRVAALLRSGGKLIGIFFYGTEPEPPPYPINKTQAAEIFGKYFRLVRDVKVSDSVGMFAGMERWQEWQLVAQRRQSQRRLLAHETR